MGAIHDPELVLQIVAASSRYEEALRDAIEYQAECYGAIALTSEAFYFSETDYYAATMGADLRKQFFAFERLMYPGDLACVKTATNEWEAMYASLGRHPEPRPVNLDPGYITPAKLVLASTKDHAHRIYLRDGIYAEITLAWRQRKWQPMDWTYPDYRRDDYQQFLTRCREWLLNCGTGGEAVK